ncbi:MAG: hypothetical protein ACI8QC_000759 [Planctomycetota bacterium]|jgi:hypothetical protein
MKPRQVLLLRAVGTTLLFAVPLALAWSLALNAFAEDPRALRWAGVGIYGVAMIGAVFVGRRLRR